MENGEYMVRCAYEVSSFALEAAEPETANVPHPIPAYTVGKNYLN
jgi:hypothetical protein